MRLTEFAQQGDRPRRPRRIAGCPLTGIPTVCRSRPILYKPHRGVRTRVEVPPLSGSVVQADKRARSCSALIQYLVNHGYAVLGVLTTGKLRPTARPTSHRRRPQAWPPSRAAIASRPGVPGRECPTSTPTGSASSAAATAVTWSWRRSLFSQRRFAVGVDISACPTGCRTLLEEHTRILQRKLQRPEALYQGDWRSGKGSREMLQGDLLARLPCR